MILSILSRGDSYGYAIIKEVRDVTNGELAWEDGMLYPILHRMEKRDLIESYPGKAENGRKRKYYRLKPQGREELTTQLGLWARFQTVLQKLNDEQLNGDVACSN